MKKIDEHKYECNDFSQSLDELAREGAQRMLMAALKAESDAYVQRFSDERDEQGRALVVRSSRPQWSCSKPTRHRGRGNHRH